MTFAALTIFAAALLVAAGSPGPSIAALIARVLTNGFRDVLPFLAAMWVGEAIWLTVAVTGLAIVANTFATLFVVMKLAGVGYLLFLAWKMWSAPSTFTGRATPVSAKPWRMFFTGLMVTLGNPKIMVFYLALVPTMIDLGRLDFLAWGELTLTMLAVLMAIDLAWALFAARARRLLTNRRAVRVANRLSAAVMVGAAVTIAAE